MCKKKDKEKLGIMKLLTDTFGNIDQIDGNVILKMWRLWHI